MGGEPSVSEIQVTEACCTPGTIPQENIAPKLTDSQITLKCSPVYFVSDTLGIFFKSHIYSDGTASYWLLRS